VKQTCCPGFKNTELGLRVVRKRIVKSKKPKTFGCKASDSFRECHGLDSGYWFVNANYLDVATSYHYSEHRSSVIATNAARSSILFLVLMALPFVGTKSFAQQAADPSNSTIDRLQYQRLDDLPNEIGVAGPIVGLHNQVLIVAGGANFAPTNDPQLWDVEKKYLDTCWILRKSNNSASKSSGKKKSSRGKIPR